MNILGLDIGTSGVKAALFDRTFKTIARSHRQYPLIPVGNDSFDLDAEMVWWKIREAIGEIAGNTGLTADAVAVSALGDVIIPLDEDGRQIRNSILDFDPRGREEIQEFIHQVGAQKFYSITGMPPIHINSLAKMLWIRKQEPQNFERVSQWASYEDFILRRLGVEPVMSHSMAARTMLFDSGRKTWSDELLDAAGLHRETLPETVPSGTVIGVLGSIAAEELGFSRNAVACSGGHDMVCAAIGAGLDEADPNTALNIVGTMEGIVVHVGEGDSHDEMLKRMYPRYPGYRGYVSLSVNLTSGSILKWFRDNISPESARKEGDSGFNELLGDIDNTKPGDLLFVPHFAGTCNPIFDPDARGLVYGLSLQSSTHDMIQGIVEGLCYELRMHIKGFRDAGIYIDRLKTVGGGSQSEKWLQLKANITGLEVVGSDTHEASSTGAAALCGSALGLLKSPFDIGRTIGAKEKRYTPIQGTHEVFEEKFLTYEKIVTMINAISTG